MRAPRRAWIGLGVLALPCMLYSMDLTVLNLAVPALAADLKPSAAQLLWIVDIYGFLVAGFLIPMGTLGDRIGRRRVLLIGAAGFGAASVLAAFAGSAEALILARALLGVAGATLAPSTLSLIAVMFRHPEERGLAIALWVASFSVGAIVGPIVGGLLIQWFWWGAAFLVGVPVMALLLALGPRLLPEYRDPGAGRIDLTSSALSLTAVLAFIYGIKRAAEQGADPVAWTAMAVGLALVAWFVHRQRRLADPLIDLTLFRSSAFSAALAINLAMMFCLFGGFVLIALYFQLVAALDAMQAAACTLVSATAFALASPMTPLLTRRWPVPKVIVGGLALAALGFAMLVPDRGLWLVVAGSVVLSIGSSPVAALVTGLVVGAAPPERAGAASALSETAAELGGALGIALLGSLATAIYRHALTGVDLGGAAFEAARTSLAAAVSLEGMPASVLTQARAAFVDGLSLAAILSALVCLGAAGLALALPREGAAARK
ncbi:MAG: MFS transporter [Alphaproteobacteria bacterium]|nr:MFS transporter [Alphaproteobacteria bacterium]